ncbi:ABC1 kinase family protein [Hahella ganghwensis]|uniref:ABC1 kinase family protein n=1 Tax=Hahella ganghwensis TaxID=286420 RepID=UPI001FE0453D|nr:AarF/ABC1/UbiB kinase family protein [Hahella ganghwensis]
MAGSRLAGNMAANLFSSRDKKEQRKREALSRQAHYLVEELGHLKGSVVKIGQVMALYGEHFLPVEVTEALHTLEDKTTALEWPVMRKVLVRELGEDRLAELEIEHEPLGAASLGQVHKAVRKSDGKVLCMKIQYPGVADAIDSDINSVATLLKMARMVSMGRDFDEWLEEVRNMMHREVNYELELETTRRFGEMLKGDDRFIVPEVFPEYSSGHVITTSFEHGVGVGDSSVAALPLARRNHLAKAALELFLRELFSWSELQTDPNFGNYRIRIGEGSGQSAEGASQTAEGSSQSAEGSDQIVLLDFGAVQKYPPAFIEPVCQMIRASYEHDLDSVIEGAIRLKFMRREWPDSVLQEFGEVCMAVLEPLGPESLTVPASAMNDNGEYRWKQSDLPTRIAKRATRSAISRYFQIPPKEFVFLNRKLVGVYTFLSVLGAEFNGREILTPYLYPEENGAEPEEH